MSLKSDPQSMHCLYCHLTHNPHLPWRSDYLWPWELFCLEFTEDDLRAVISYINHLRIMGRPARSFIFRQFITGGNSIQYFREDLAEARAWSRQTSSRPDSGRAQVLAQSGRMEPVKDNVVTPAQVLAGNEALKKLLELRESL